MQHIEKADVIIVGAGASGLAAAHALTRQGRSVVVVEARSRCGGRILTQSAPSVPFPIEYGAEFIHGIPPESWQIINAANLAFYEIADKHLIFRDGKLADPAAFGESRDSLREKMKNG